MSDKDVLISMGFDPARVEWALRATNNKGLQPAMDFILEHNDDPIPDPTSASSSAHPQSEPIDVDDDEDTAALRAVYGSADSAAGVEARVRGWDHCCRHQMLRVREDIQKHALANFHAEKSGHDQFEESTEEIKPLTEEEKQQKLVELRDKMNEKRMKKAAEEAKEAKANELIRARQENPRRGSQEASQIKEDLKNKQILKDLEAKRREKEDEKKALAAIKAQIEIDKRERAEKAAQEKALREGVAPPASIAGTSAPPAAPATVTASVPGREFKETRLQIRLATGGQPLTTTLPSDSTLREVAEFVAGQTTSVDVDTVTFTQHFPRKQFSSSDFSRSLRDLGLTPSAVLIAS
ncbi:ubiquitin-related domain-containing protein [Lactarius quietus]|nr:ubiquitin-related domain-containing protein [Lactarius quietus]